MPHSRKGALMKVWLTLSKLKGETMKKLLIATIAIASAGSVFAQTPGAPADAKSQGKVEQAQIKAHKKVDEALTDEARANTKAEAKADDKKLKAHHKAQKKIDDAAADVTKAQNKAEVEAAKNNK
jgi:hypothetical protein